jgi:hypothetical protein
MTEPASSFKNPPFEARQYLLTLVLLGLGVWCVRDGWFNPAEEMERYRLFNRAAGIALLIWGTWDGWRMRRREIAYARRLWEKAQAVPPADA